MELKYPPKQDACCLETVRGLILIYCFVFVDFGSLDLAIYAIKQ